MSEQIKNIGIIGTGTMGKQIAERAALHNYSVRVFDVNPEGLEKFVKRVNLKVKNKGVSGDITVCNNLVEVVSNVDLVIEAVPEKLELKKDIFAQIDKAAPPNTILATNSSSIPISKIEDSVDRKDKVLNLHFYKLPTYLMADIMRGTNTSDNTFDLGKRWIESLEITPLVVKKECMGFVFNRVWRAIKKEALKIWAGGYADFQDVDKAWKIFTRMPIGPFRLMDMVGLDVVYDIEMSYYKDSGDPKDEPPQALKDMVERGELGHKSGKGFYTYK